MTEGKRSIIQGLLLQEYDKECKEYPCFSSCATNLWQVRINASAYYLFFYRNSQKVGSNDYLRLMRLQQIWAEGTVAVLEREHKLNEIQKRVFKGVSPKYFLSFSFLHLLQQAIAFNAMYPM